MTLPPTLAHLSVAHACRLARCSPASALRDPAQTSTPSDALHSIHSMPALVYIRMCLYPRINLYWQVSACHVVILLQHRVCLLTSACVLYLLSCPCN